MSGRPDDLAVERALSTALELLDVPGVEGVGRGETEDGRPGVLVLCAGLTDELRHRLPEDIEGVPVIPYDLGGPLSIQPGDGPFDAPPSS